MRKVKKWEVGEDPDESRKMELYKYLKSIDFSNPDTRSANLAEFTKIMRENNLAPDFLMKPPTD